MSNEPKKPFSKKQFYISFFCAAIAMVLIGITGVTLSKNDASIKQELAQQSSDSESADGKEQKETDSNTELAENDNTLSNEVFYNESDGFGDGPTDMDVPGTITADSGNDSTNVNDSDLQNDTSETTSSAVINEETATQKNEEKSTKKNKKKQNDSKETMATETSLSFKQENGLLWPVIGDVILNFSMEHGVYFKTLGQYKCNPAVLIGCAEGSEIYAASDGIVDAITEDEETGTTLTVSLGDGYELVYGQLKDIKVSVGDTVTEGQTLGILAAPTKYYVSEGDNLYFQLSKDGTPVDPEPLLR